MKRSFDIQLRYLTKRKNKLYEKKKINYNKLVIFKEKTFANNNLIRLFSYFNFTSTILIPENV